MQTCIYPLVIGFEKGAHHRVLLTHTSEYTRGLRIEEHVIVKELKKMKGYKPQNNNYYTIPLI